MPTSGVNPPPVQNAVVSSGGIATQFWQRWFASIGRVIGVDGAYHPPTFTDLEAPLNSIYYSSTQSKACYRDASGTVHALY